MLAVTIVTQITLKNRIDFSKKKKNVSCFPVKYQNTLKTLIFIKDKAYIA